MMKYILYSFYLFIIFSCTQKDINRAAGESDQNWTHYVRIAGHGLNIKNIDKIIAGAQEAHIFGIEVDNSLTGYYESFLNPTEKLAAIEAMAKRAHEIGNHAFIYTEGLETITSDANQKEHTFYKDHPDWVQRDIDDRPAVFGGGAAFWISEGDEDVWISPYASEWRNMFMERIRQIARTGIDGIFIDIPYWMTHFKGWEATWASFDIYTVEAFKEKTGLDAKNDFKLGNFTDPNFRKWVDFRIESLTDFMADVTKNAKSVNPNIKVIAEIYPGINESAVRVGADVYKMYQVVDVVAHEFSGGGGNAASKNPLNWFSRMVGMYTFRAFAEGKASWMLSYSWMERNKVDPAEPMKNLALSNVMAGTNCWDAQAHVMSGSNDIETRKEIFKWIADNEETFYKPRTPIKPIGVYFSPKTRNYFANDFIKSYQGIMYLLMQAHLEFQIVTPRTLDHFLGTVLILPDVKCISDAEVASIESYVTKGNGLVITEETGQFDETGLSRKNNPFQKLLIINDPMQEQVSSGELSMIYYPNCPGKAYMESCRRDFNEAAWEGTYNKTEFHSLKNSFVSALEGTFKYQSSIKIVASPFISAQITEVKNSPHIFLANFKGLKNDEITKQIPEENVTIAFPNTENAKIYFLPYLGEKIELKGQVKENQFICTLPSVDKGAVVWVE
jgi:hypothetical protein